MIVGATMRKISAGIVSLLCSILTFHAQDSALRRVAQSHSIESMRDPRLQIELPRQTKFVGTDHWTLFGVTDCELFVFVEADARKTIQRLYWIQFEAYVPSRPELKYEYPFKQTANLGGLQFDVRTRFGPTSEKPKEGSDGEHFQKLLLKNGYTFPAEMMNVRFVYLPDAAKRKEMMIIYSEDMKATGLTSTELIRDGKIDDRWNEVQKGLIDRAMKRIRIKQKHD